MGVVARIVDEGRRFAARIDFEEGTRFGMRYFGTTLVVLRYLALSVKCLLLVRLLIVLPIIAIPLVVAVISPYGILQQTLIYCESCPSWLTHTAIVCLFCETILV